MTDRRSPDAFATRPWATSPPPRDPDMDAVPTMLAQEERDFYHWLTSSWTQDAGDVVDLGCYLGGSTARLAAGHAAGRKTSTIHAYDRFTSDERTKERILYRQGIPPFAGNDIFPISQRLLAPWSDRVRLRRGEIEAIGWDGGPIELLVVDAFKKADLTDVMTDQFYPWLIPGKSLILHQDYLHWSQPWVAAQMELLGEAVTPVAFARDDTVAWLVEQPLTPAKLTAARVAALSDAELLDLLAKAEARFEGWGLAPRLALSARALRANPGARMAWQMKMPG
jgi:hypothetical protein